MLKVDPAHQQDLQSKPPQSQFENFSRDTVPLSIYFINMHTNCAYWYILHLAKTEKKGQVYIL